MRIAATKTKTVDTDTAGYSFRDFRPRREFCWYPEALVERLELRVQVLEEEIWRNVPILDTSRGFEKTSETSCALKMT